MRKSTVLAIILFVFVSCQQNSASKNIIEKEKMLNLMLDMQLTDAYLNQVYNNDTMKMQAHSRYNYLFKKYETDSASFSNSLKFYSQNAVQLDEMYTQISDSLTRLQKNVNLENDARRMQAKSIYDYMFSRFNTGSVKFTNSRSHYRLNIKEQYKLYHNDADGVKETLTDSVKQNGLRRLKRQGN